jgi:serine/threonine protein kinase
MDYCSLGSISDVLAECNPLNEDQIAHVCTEVLKGLAYLHASKIIHRDVKAANILLTNQAHVKIVDFGISAQIDKSEKLNEPVGSPFWMAPEVIMETEHTYKCDIWSLGITLLEMAEGAPPHSNIHPFRALFLIPKKPPPTFSDPSKWSPEVQDFVSLCLQKQPHERPSAIELLGHPFITGFMKKSQGPEVLRSTIISYLKAKKEKQMRLKREIAKLGRPTPLLSLSNTDQSTNPDKSLSTSSSPPSSPRTPTTPPIPTTDDLEVTNKEPNAANNTNTNTNPNPNTIELSPVMQHSFSNERTDTFGSAQVPRKKTNELKPVANGVSMDESDSDTSTPTDYRTMFVLGTLNTGDMPAHMTQQAPEQNKPKISNSQEFVALRQMIVDAKIEICRVREEVSNQHVFLKNELQDIKTKLTELTTFFLPAPPPNPIRKKTSSELSVHRK